MGCWHLWVELFRSFLSSRTNHGKSPASHLTVRRWLLSLPNGNMRGVTFFLGSDHRDVACNMSTGRNSCFLMFIRVVSLPHTFGAPSLPHTFDAPSPLPLWLYCSTKITSLSHLLCQLVNCSREVNGLPWWKFRTHSEWNWFRLSTSDSEQLNQFHSVWMRNLFPNHCEFSLFESAKNFVNPVRTNPFYSEIQSEWVWLTSQEFLCNFSPNQSV